MSEPAPAGSARDRPFGAAAVATTTVIAACSFAFGTGLGGDTFARGLANVLQIVSPALASVLCVVAARRSQGLGWRIGWMLVAASCASWALGQVIWTWLETVEGQLDPFPSAADLFYLLAVPLAVAGMLYFPSAPSSSRGRTRTLLDGMLVAASVLFVSWVFVLGPTLEDGSGTPLERAIGLAYPAADVVLLTIVIIAYVRCDPAGRVATGLVALGFAAFALADSVFAYTALHADTVSEISNAAWVSGYLLIGLGALHASRHPPSRVSTLAPPVRSGPIAILLPYLPVAVVLAVCAGVAVVTDPIVVDDTVFWIGASIIALLLVRQGFVILENARLARSLEASNERLQYQVLHDGLTGLPNRPLFLDRLRMALARTSRLDECLAVMFLDLDRFKPVNDDFGHEAGDAVLDGVGRHLSAAVRAGDTVARFGGDEFLVLCENVGGLDEATTMAGRLADAIARPILVGDHAIAVQASIGLVLIDSIVLDADEVVRQADAAMYRAKREGRGRIELVDARAGAATAGV